MLCPGCTGGRSQALIDSGQTAVKVARELGISRATLYRALEGRRQ